jgi:p-cumate 2,3-dioxygenase alpha subunit
VATEPHVVDDRQHARFSVHRGTMRDPALLTAERRTIFDRSWLYVGHESEIREAHQWRARNVGGRPIIFVRDANLEMHVFFNLCSHRGTTLCREPSGESRSLTCFYHAWTFDTSGNLTTLPGESAYGPEFDRSALALISPPRVDAYRGFVFLNYDANAVSLVDYLGGAREYLDLIVDQGLDAGLEVLRGTHEYTIKANWKLLAENSFDAYHVAPTHRRYLRMVSNAGAATLTDTPGERAITAGIDLGRGHAAIATIRDEFRLGRPLSADAAAAEAQQRARLDAVYDPAWVDRMYGIRNVVIFPSLVVIDLVGGIIVRTMFPRSAEEVEVSSWELAPVGEHPGLRAARLDNFLTFWGPAGFATPDDVEALEAIQRGFAASDFAPWSDISRGMTTERARHSDELQMRVFWRRWNEAMTGERSEPESHVTPAPLRAPRQVLDHSADRS